MALAQEPSAPLETRDQLIEELTAGMKPREQWMIGTEHEKFPFTLDDIKTVPFEGEAGIEALLQGLLDGTGNYEGVYEGDHLIALKMPSGCGKFSASITLEPGGQFELSGAPFKNLHQTAQELDDHLKDVEAVAKPMGLGFLGLGYTPKFSLTETPEMPKGRYDVMRAYMPTVGDLGLNMMHCSSTVQVNLDFSSEADMVKKFRVGLALQPFATALFANSVFKEGKLNGFQSFRSEVWRNVDADRTGMLPFVFEKGMSFERYVDYALGVPMYFVVRDGKYLDTHGKNFADFLAGNIEGLEKVRPNEDDWELHLTTLFPEVRLKQFLEMRGADCGPQPFLPALSAFWVGLLYDDGVLDAAYDLIKGWDEKTRQTLRDDVPKLGLKAKIGKHNVLDVSSEIMAMADAGLKGRALLNDKGQSEQVYLEPLHEIVGDGWSLADQLIDRFNNVWDEDIHQLYKTLAL